MWHELFHYHELQRLACLLSEGVFRSLCCLAGEMWRSRRLCVDPSSGMESLSVKKKSFSVDGPGPAGSSTTPTHTLRPVCPFTVDCHVKHIDSLWNQNHGLTVNKIHTYVAIMPCGKKKPCFGRHKICVFPEEEGLLWCVNVSALETAWQHLICCSRWSTRPAMLAIPVARSRSGQQLTIAFVWALEVQQILRETIDYFPTAGSAAYRLQCG